MVRTYTSKHFNMLGFFYEYLYFLLHYIWIIDEFPLFYWIADGKERKKKLTQYFVPYKKKKSEDERKEDFKEQKNQSGVSIMYTFMYTAY